MLRRFLLFAALGIFITLAGLIYILRTDVAKQPDQTVALFYGALRRQDRTGISNLFASDDSLENVSERSRLFTGKDVDGVPGGPTLFESNSANFMLQSYVITSKLATSYHVQEVRSVNGKNQSCSMIIDLTQEHGGWFIKRYSSEQQHGVYSGFMLQ